MPAQDETPLENDPTARKTTPEPVMPKGSELYTPWCRELLRAARSGKLHARSNSAQHSDGKTVRFDNKENTRQGPSSDDKELDSLRGAKRGATDGFLAIRWTQIPEPQEEPERNRLAKRRKGLPPVHAIADAAPNTHMRKTKVRRMDENGQPTVFEVMVPQGQFVEGEIHEEVTLETAAAAIAAPKPGTIVEGLGVANEQGVLIASEGVANLKKKGPVTSKKKKGPGRWQQKLSDMTTGGVSASAEALEERKRQEAAGLNEGNGTDAEKANGREGGDDGDGESEEEVEDGEGGDRDREGGELSTDREDEGAAPTVLDDFKDGTAPSRDPDAMETEEPPKADAVTPAQEKEPASEEKEAQADAQNQAMPPSQDSENRMEESLPSEQPLIPVEQASVDSTQPMPHIEDSMTDIDAPPETTLDNATKESPAESPDPLTVDTTQRVQTASGDPPQVAVVEEDTVMEEASNLPDQVIEQPGLIAEATVPPTEVTVPTPPASLTPDPVLVEPSQAASEQSKAEDVPPKGEEDTILVPTPSQPIPDSPPERKEDEDLVASQAEPVATEVPVDSADPLTILPLTEISGLAAPEQSDIISLPRKSSTSPQSKPIHQRDPDVDQDIAAVIGVPNEEPEGSVAGIVQMPTRDTVPEDRPAVTQAADPEVDRDTPTVNRTVRDEQHELGQEFEPEQGSQPKQISQPEQGPMLEQGPQSEQDSQPMQEPQPEQESRREHEPQPEEEAEPRTDPSKRRELPPPRPDPNPPYDDGGIDELDPEVAQPAITPAEGSRREQSGGVEFEGVFAGDDRGVGEEQHGYQAADEEVRGDEKVVMEEPLESLERGVSPFSPVRPETEPLTPEATTPEPD